MWTKEQEDTEVKSTYQYIIDLKEKLSDTCAIAHERLVDGRYKEYYDRGKKPRGLDIGDKALVLLPTDQSKLLLQWKGPYDVVAKIGDCDYRIQVDGKVKTFHINLLKRYIARYPKKLGAMISLEIEPAEDDFGSATAAVCSATSSEITESQEDGGIVPLPSSKRTQTCEDIHVSNELNLKQKSEIKLMRIHSQMFIHRCS